MWLRALGLVFLYLASASAGEAQQFLIVSQPILAKIVFIKVAGPDGKINKPQDLITDGLQKPEGIAVDSKTNRLFVADTMQKKVLFYQMVFSDGKIVIDGEQGTAAQDVSPRWVAVDGVGNIFFTDGKNNLIQKVFADRLELGDVRAATLYKGEQIYQVSSPRGIAVDNFHIYWANGMAGLEMGSLAMGMENPPDTNLAQSVRTLTSNSLSSFGTCLSATNVFYTGADKFLYAVKKTGGPAVTVIDTFAQPRGCVWDGDGTMYVADKGHHAVYSFAGSMNDLGPQRKKKVVDVDDPFGIAILSISNAPGPRFGLLSVAIVLISLVQA